MIVEQFIQWVVTAEADKRAQATHALARAYLKGSFSVDDMDSAEAAMTFLLDDPDTNVRAALADVLAGSKDAPRHIVLGLLDDISEIGALVAARSPLLLDSELVEIVAVRDKSYQLAVAGRMPLSASVSAAIAEVTAIDVCMRLLSNDEAIILPQTFMRLAERFGQYEVVQQLLLEHESLPVSVRQLVIVNISDAMCEAAIFEERMQSEQAEDVAREARDRATLTLAQGLRENELLDLIHYLRESEQLTTVLMLRSLCAGQISFFIQAISLLSDVPINRVLPLLNDPSAKALKSIYLKAGLPLKAYQAFAIAFAIYKEQGVLKDQTDQYRFTRILIERVLEYYRGNHSYDVDELLAMMRRFASETARDAARNYINLQLKVA